MANDDYLYRRGGMDSKDVYDENGYARDNLYHMWGQDRNPTIVPIDDIYDRTRENGWYQYPESGRWMYLMPQDQRLPHPTFNDKLYQLYADMFDKENPIRTLW